MKFRLEITLGNDAMQTFADIREALLLCADNLGEGAPESGDSKRIGDLNGNTVGRWEIDHG